MSSAEFRPNYTVDDYRQWQGDWELWQGIPVSMVPSPFGRHSSATGKIVTSLNNAIATGGCNETTLVELDWMISADTVVRPDVVIVCGGPPERHLETRPEIVVEVLSETTRDRDLTFKKRLYEAQQVPYYLIVDPDSSQLNGLKLDSGKYVEFDSTESLSMTICLDCQIEICVASIFGRAGNN